jgi:hypothetical protein
MPSIEDIGKGLLGQLNTILTGGDGRVPPSVENKISWCQPAIPFAPEDFDFAARGLGSATTAEQQKVQYQQAFNLAMAVDFVPDVSGVYNGDQQQTIYRTSEARMSHMYNETLRASKVVKTELTPEEKAKLEKFRKLMYTTKTEKNLVTDEEKQVTVPGPVLEAYNAALQDSLDARLLYNAKRIAAMSATGQDTLPVNDWAINAENYFSKVRAADARWVSQGYKNEVEQMNAYINQVTLRDMHLWKQGLLELMDRAKLTDISSGLPFYYTTLIPGGFARSSGWTGYKYYSGTTASNSRWSTSSWSGGAGIGVGLWSFGANASSSSQRFHANSSCSSFAMSFELAQVVVTRPWFYPEFFMNRGWTLKPGQGWTYDQLPSDGASPPHGNLIGYPTSIIFARNIMIDSSDFASAFDQQSSSVSGGGSVGFGPFHISGSYSHAQGSTNCTARRSGSSITVPGMQIIAFVNHLIPKAPDPLPSIPAESFE